MVWSSPPSFWSKKFSFLALFLSPLGFFLTMASRLRQKLTFPHHVSIPVICVGNVVVGGAGKTPLVIELAKFLQRQGFIPHILSRGYGVHLHTPVLVCGDHGSNDVGDEALLLAKVAPTWVYKNRYQTAQLAIQSGATILLMDDGFQNPTLYKNIQLLVLDDGQGIGNGYVMPAGPLREPLKDALKRASAVLVYNKREDFSLASQKPVFSLETISNCCPLASHYIAFAGIGRPKKFFDSLEKKGFSLVKTFSFPDHHIYTDQDMEKLLSMAKKYQARLITTEKDIVKIPSSLRSFFDIFSVSTRFLDPVIFQEWLLQELKN